MSGKVFYRVQVGADRILRVVAALELIQHLLPQMGHKSLLVTQTLHCLKGWDHPCRSVLRDSGLVQTP
jgi:hypothetical protein